MLANLRLISSPVPPHRWLRNKLELTVIDDDTVPPHRWLRNTKATRWRGKPSVPPHRWLRKTIPPATPK